MAAREVKIKEEEGRRGGGETRVEGIFWRMVEEYRERCEARCEV